MESLLVVSFYLENVFIITVIVVGLAIFIPVMAVLILKQRGSSIEERPEIRDFVLNIGAGLLMAGLVMPLIITVLMKVSPNFVEEAAPYAGYIIIPIVIFLIFTNIKRFKLLRKIESGQMKENNSDEIVLLQEKAQKYRFEMITSIILIAYLAVLFSLRSF